MTEMRDARQSRPPSQEGSSDLEEKELQCLIQPKYSDLVRAEKEEY
jgi:hypothetical protein